MADLQETSTQELADELFSRSDWKDAKLPSGTQVERGKMKANCADQRGSDNYVFPVIRLDQVPLGEVFDKDLAESFWRPHVNALRVHGLEERRNGAPDILDNAKVEIAHKHLEENTVGFRDAKVNGEHAEIPVVEIHASKAGEITSQEQEKLEAISTLQRLRESGQLSDEEILAQMDNA